MTISSVPPQIPNTDLLVMVSCYSIASYNVFEILLWVFVTFKRRRGMYFWSMQAASWGIVVYLIFAMTGKFTSIPNLPASLGTLAGFLFMTIAPLVMLYSRLHFVVIEARKIRWMLYMIIILSVILAPVMGMVILGTGRVKPHFNKAITVMGAFILTCVCLFELFLSGIYIREAFVNLKPIFAVKGRQGRDMLILLVIIYILFVIILASLIMFQYTPFKNIALSYCAFVYGVKLKTEIVILTKLVNLVQNSNCSCRMLHPYNSSDDVHAIRLHPCPSSSSNQAPNPEQRGSGISTPTRWDSTHDLHETTEERTCPLIPMSEFSISLPVPPRALSSEHLAMGPESQV